MDSDITNLAVDQCKYFAEFFVKHFEEKRNSYYDEAVGIIRRNGQPLKCLEPASAGLRGGGCAVGGLGIATGIAVGSQIGSGLGVAAGLVTTFEKIGNFVSNLHHKQKAERVSNILWTGEKKEKTREILVQASIKIYQSYQDVILKQTKNETWRLPLRKLSRDAVDRIMDYINLYKKEKEDDIVTVDVNFIIEAFYNGNSKGFFKNKMPKHKIPFTKAKWTFSFINEKACVMNTSQNTTNYYKKRVNKYIKKPRWENIELYGFRITNDVNIDAKEYIKLAEKGVEVYNLLTDSLLNQIMEETLTKLDKDDPKRISERIETTLDEIKEDVRETKRQVSNIQAEHSEDIIRFNFKEPVKSFTGRFEVIEQIHNFMLNNLNERMEVCQCICISGCTGSGKTELARMYGNKYKEVYDSIIWIDAENIQSLRDSFKNLAKKLNIKLNNTLELNEKEQIRNINDIMEEVYIKFKNKKCLFVFDNAKDIADIQEYLPYKFLNEKTAYTILTSINNQWDIGESGHIEVISIDVFTQEEATDYVKKSLDINEDNENVLELVITLEKLPLILHLAVSDINERKQMAKLTGSTFDIQDYLKIFKSIELLNYPVKTNARYAKPLLTTWTITKSKITELENGKEAIKILEIISFFSPDNINFESCFSTNKNFWKSVKLLHTFSLVKAQSGRGNIHRFNQEIIRHELKENNREIEVLKSCIELIIKWDGVNNNHAFSILKNAWIFDELVNDFPNFNILTKTLNFYCKYGCSLDEIETVNLLLNKIVIDKEKHYNKASFIAVQNGNFNILELLFLHGASVNYNDNDGWSLLHSSSFNGSFKIVEFLLRKNAFVQCKDIEGFTPLHCAATSGHLNILKGLITYNASINAKDNYGYTPIHSACANGHINIVECLINKKACVDIKDIHERTPLHRAALHNHFKIIKLLVENGADVNSCTNVGWSVLHNATQSGDLETVKFLVKNGANVKAVDKFGWSPLRTSTKRTFIEISKFLIENGACVNQKDIYGCTCLHTTARIGNLKMSTLLITWKADVNSEDINKRTPLHNAVSGGYLNVVKALVDNGADVNFAAEDGSTPLHDLSKYNPLKKKCSCYEKCVKKYAKCRLYNNVLNAKDKVCSCVPYDVKILEQAAQNSLEIARYLIENNADLLITDGNNQTVSNVARSNEFFELVELFGEAITA